MDAKQQAHQVAVEIFKKCFEKHQPYSVSAEVKLTLMESISTALEKLLAENERLKIHHEEEGRVRLFLAGQNRKLADIQSRLTATEARLLEVMADLQNVADTGIHVSQPLTGEESCAPCLAYRILSTLTAEKKEQG